VLARAACSNRIAAAPNGIGEQFAARGHDLVELGTAFAGERRARTDAEHACQGFHVAIIFG
jgi:hypothetical protein